MKFLLLLFLFQPLRLFSQGDSIITYTGVVQVEGVSKDELFKRARQWFAETFVSANDVLQINDKESGELSGKGVITVILKIRSFGKREVPEPCDVFLNVWTKDGKYKYSFSNFVVDVGGTTPFPLRALSTRTECPNKMPLISQKKMDEIWESAKDAVAERIKLLIKDIDDQMKKKSVSDF